MTKILKKIVLIAVILVSYVSIYGEEAVSSNYPVIFVHGIFAGFEKWKEIGKSIGGENYFEMRINDNGNIEDNYKEGTAGREVWNISYYTPDMIEEIGGNLDIYTDRVDVMIEKIKKYTKEDKVIIIAHSMGGLVTRNYMSKNKERYEGVYKILTVATPNSGIEIAPPIIGQFKDLNSNSKFLEKLNKQWSEYKDINKKWGVVGAVDRGNIFNQEITEESTDSAGPGYVKISGAIPYGEWKKCVEKMEIPILNSSYFPYMVALFDNHNDVLKNEGVKKAVRWAIE